MCYDLAGRAFLQLANNAGERLLKQDPASFKDPKMRAKDLISAFRAAAKVDADDILMTLIFRGNILRLRR